MALSVNGTGCSLIDYLYDNIDFSAAGFQRYASVTNGDGGLSPGRLVFAEELERFAGRPVQDVLRDLTGGKVPDAVNLGGPAVVALVGAAQLLAGREIPIRFFGARGVDATGKRIMEFLSQTTVETNGYDVAAGPTPFTYVLSDPAADCGRGERSFVNNIGAAWNYGAQSVPDSIPFLPILLQLPPGCILDLFVGHVTVGILQDAVRNQIDVLWIEGQVPLLDERMNSGKRSKHDFLVPT